MAGLGPAIHVLPVCIVDPRAKPGDDVAARWWDTPAAIYGSASTFFTLLAWTAS